MSPFRIRRISRARSRLHLRRASQQLARQKKKKKIELAKAFEKGPLSHADGVGALELSYSSSAALPRGTELHPPRRRLRATAIGRSRTRVQSRDTTMPSDRRPARHEARVYARQKRRKGSRHATCRMRKEKGLRGVDRLTLYTFPVHNVARERLQPNISKQC